MTTGIELTRPVGEIVAESIGRSEVFEKFGIDYCCGGAAALGEACKAKGIDAAAVMEALNAYDAAANGGAENAINPATMGLTELCDHIEQTHHAYLRDALPRITGLTAKIAEVYRDSHPELAGLAQVYAGLRLELEQHMLKEEQILFPVIREMEATDGNFDFHCGSLSAPISVMEMEHDNAGGALAKMRAITRDYIPPVDACTTYKAMLDALATLERDLHIHIHKENNVLFPRALAMEQESQSAAASQ